MKAVITAQFDPAVLARLRQQMEVVHTGWGVTGQQLTEEALIAELQDAEILVTEIEKCSGPVIERCPKLVFIGCCRNNPVNIDAAAATQRGIPVVYTPGRNAWAVAETTMALMLMIARRLDAAVADVREGRWTLDAVASYLHYKGHELYGKTVGIAGLGAIGRLVKRLCEAFGMQAIVYDPYLEQQGTVGDDITFVSLEELLHKADFVTIHVPDTPDTMGLIGAAELASMKPTAYLINTARGRHVDQEALAHALKDGQIAGAALDVFYHEPLPPDHPFLKLDNVILTPHLGGATHEVISHQSRMVYEQIQHFLKGELVHYLRNPEVLAG